jgi:hypothetical protein
MESPADIITYIGVPLAVLDVSPILYNFIIAFFIKLRFKATAESLRPGGYDHSKLIHERGC